MKETEVSHRDVVSVAFDDHAEGFDAKHAIVSLVLGVAWHGRCLEESTKESAFHVGLRRELLRFFSNSRTQDALENQKPDPSSAHVLALAQANPRRNNRST